MNKIFKRCIVFIVVSIIFSGVVMGGIPAQERAALIALYNATNGDIWVDQSGWKTAPLDADGFAMPGTEGNWFGVFVLTTPTVDQVVKIFLPSNNLNGTIPATMGKLERLQVINLENNRLLGSIPSEIASLGYLEVLNLRHNNLVGSIPQGLGNLGNLQYLDLGENKLIGSIPPELGNLGNLEYLALPTNMLEGSIPASLGNLSQLQHLDLQDNQLGGGIPYQLGNLSKLQVMNLSNNPLGGSIPSQLGNLANLTNLLLYADKLNGAIPPELGKLGNLNMLYLNQNNLSGSIPSQLGNLSNLETFWLNNNQLSGAIPPELGNLAKLVILDISANFLSGSIPSQLGNLSKARRIAFAFNTISGTIPSELGNLTSVEQLLLNYNLLIGTVPANLLNLNALEVLDISVNCLFVTDPAVRAWLDNVNQGWEHFQNQCGGTVSELNPPFGSFDSPVEGAAVSGSIAVTGWALDDSGVESVKIYLNLGNMQLYIGDALFVEGARPDVDATYPSYPFHSRGGWGYMLLTNFLPQQGNGVFVLSAVATDSVGKTTTLGTKTIHVDNAHAVKPFGAIDTPIQGGIAAGSSFVNWGWVLTPQPNSIPTNGSTIDVWVDGVNLGHPVYNVYRTDIATLFPGYANSNGAVGHFTLNTTPYQNGVHTIQWTARDNGGNSDGIGSRYFTIQNAVPDNTQETYSAAIKRDITEIAQFPEEFSEAITFKKGFKSKGNGEELLPDETGKNQLQIKELERVEIQLGKSYADIEGYLVYNNELNNLPIGSTLDTESGTFSWSPGPGFLGKYSLVFVLTDTNGLCSKKKIDIIIKSKKN